MGEQGITTSAFDMVALKQKDQYGFTQVLNHIGHVVDGAALPRVHCHTMLDGYDHARERLGCPSLKRRLGMDTGRTAGRRHCPE